MNLISGDPAWLATSSLYIDHDIRVVISEEEEEKFVKDLSESIKRVGLIHWISVVDEVESKRYRIVAGRERYKACVLLGAETVPCSILTEEQAKNAELIELLENTDRKDFKPLEIILQVDKVHSDGLEKNSMHNHQNTADYLKKSRSFVTRMLKLATLYGKLLIICENINDENYKDQEQIIKWDYELLREFLWADSMNKIEKAVREYEQNYIIKGLGEGIKKDNNAEIESIEEYSEVIEPDNNIIAPKAEKWRTTVIKNIQTSYKIGDTFSFLKNIPSKIADMCFWDIDPPYGIEYETKDKEYKDIKNYEAAITGYDKITYEMVRISGDNSKALIWHAAEPKYGNLVQETLTKYGWTFDLHPFIWIKPKGNSRNRSKLLPRCYEQCTIAYAPGASLFGNDLNRNWFECDSHPPASDRYHPNEKPIDLMHFLYYGFFTFGSLAHWFIPFAGSGKGVYLAAKQDPKYLYAADLSQKYKDQLLIDIKEEII